MPSYNDLRVAYGLDPVSSFAELTGEASQDWPSDPQIGSDPINDPDILDFVHLLDAEGDEIAAGSSAADTSVVTAVRRTTLAARLAVIYGDVDSVDAFVGMVSEPHVDGSEMGELQLAMWTSQFTALRDGDRFFYGNDPVLEDIAAEYGIDFRRSLATVIEDNTDADEVPDAVFRATADDETAGGGAHASDDGTEGKTVEGRRGDAGRREPGDRPRREDRPPRHGGPEGTRPPRP